MAGDGVQISKQTQIHTSEKMNLCVKKEHQLPGLNYNVKIDVFLPFKDLLNPNQFINILNDLIIIIIIN